MSKLLQSSVKSDNQSLESDQKIVLSQDPLIADAIDTARRKEEKIGSKQKKGSRSIPDL